MDLTPNNSEGDKISLSLFTSTKPRNISKGFKLDKTGELQKIPGGAMSLGKCERLQLKDITELAKKMATLAPSNALAYGVSEYKHAIIHTKKALAVIKKNGGNGNGKPTIARDREHFQWPEGKATMMIDYDPEKGTPPMSGEDFLEAVYSVCQEIRHAPHLLVPSASTFIYEGDKCHKGSAGWRLLVVVSHGTDIKRAGETFVKRCWLTGFGFIFFTKNGRMLPRCELADASVFQPERLDFCGPPTCTPPLEQRRPAPMVLNNDAAPLDTAQALKALTLTEEDDFLKLKGAAIREARPESNRIKKEWVGEQVKAALVDVPPDEQEEAEAALIQTYTMAAEKSILMGDYVLRHTSGETVTVGEALDNPDKWHGERFHDPLEPEYGGNDSRIAWMNLRAAGRPFLYSHAHGGTRFVLVRARETLRLIAGERVSIVREALEGMRIFGTHYRRGNEIVVITQDSEILPRTIDGIQWDLDTLFRFEKYNKTEELWLPCDCNRPIASGVLAAQGSWGLNELTGLCTAPTLDPLTGRLIDEDGYDKKTGLMLVLNDNSQWDGIPTEPKAGDVERAVNTIWEPFKEFPFDGAISKGVMLTAFLTACIRPLLPTAPGVAFDAPIAGSGKTLLAKCLSITAGDNPAMLPDAGDPEEIRKRLLALLRQNKRVMVMDNVTGLLDSSALAAMLTAETYTDRVLGVSETISVPTRTLLLITGNNITVVGDLCRRILSCRIDPNDETPWKRTFALDPAEYCREHRLAMVAAGLTVIRAGIQSGPEIEDRTASFEVWSDTVRRAVCLVGKYGFLDVTDPVDSIDVAYGADPETGKLGALLSAWWDIWKDAPIKTATLIKFAQSEGKVDFDSEDESGLLYPELNEAVDAICGNGKTLDTRRLGIWIGKNKARIVDEWRIVESEKSKKSHKVKEWCVMPTFF